MPLTHVRTFRVRHYECDANGHVNHANYLRYAQETAFDASAAAGYDLARYQAMDRNWLARETEIEHLSPLCYGDSVQVKTWVADFRRVRSRRAYEFRHVGSGELVARASTDWVHLELSTGRPALISPAMKAAFFPEGMPEPAPARERFPAAPPPPPGVFWQQRRVEWRDLDPVGHVNNSVYLSYLEDCGRRALAARGWPIARLEAEGFAIVARHHHIKYQQPAMLDYELVVTTWLSDLQDNSGIRHTTITSLSDGASLASARTRHVWVNLTSGKPTTLPAAFLDDFAPSPVHSEQQNPLSKLEEE